MKGCDKIHLERAWKSRLPKAGVITKIKQRFSFVSPVLPRALKETTLSLKTNIKYERDGKRKQWNTFLLKLRTLASHHISGKQVSLLTIYNMKPDFQRGSQYELNSLHIFFLIFWQKTPYNAIQLLKVLIIIPHNLQHNPCCSYIRIIWEWI